MIKIDSHEIEEAVYNLCISANTIFGQSLYDNIYSRYSNAVDELEKNKLFNILLNIELAQKKKRPLCQDTGQVIVFAEIGQRVLITGNDIISSINNAVEKAYKENFYRKSIVKNALFNRTNTDTNTPAIIYTDIKDSDTINLKLLIKGAGSENYSTIKMFQPASSKQDIFEFIKQSIQLAGEKSCPPLVLGIGAGGTMDNAAILSKKALFNQKETEEEKKFISELSGYLKDYDNDILEIKIKSASTHIACLPIALTINCHSMRHGECDITKHGITYKGCQLLTKDLKRNKNSAKEIFANDFDTLRKLKNGEHILLTGEILTSRDAAHQRIISYYEQHGELPFDLKDKIIFYAGPCPAAPDEITGPIGPTTSARMDKFCSFIYSKGLLASIGKGERSKEAKDAIRECNGKYFTAQGGVACLLAECVKSSEPIAFEELGTEAVRKLYVQKLPLTVVI